MRQILRLSGSGTLQILIGTASWIGLVRILVGFGSAALAGYTIAMRLIIFALLPSLGPEQRRGDDGRPEPGRAEAGPRGARGLARRAVQRLLPGCGRARLLRVRAPRSCGPSPPTRRSAAYAVDCLRIVALGFLLYAYGMVLTQSFNGAGDTWTPTWINLVCFWLFEIPLAYLLANVVGSARSAPFSQSRSDIPPGSGERRAFPARSVEAPPGVTSIRGRHLISGAETHPGSTVLVLTRICRATGSKSEIRGTHVFSG